MQFALNIPLTSLASEPEGSELARLSQMTLALEEAGLSACLTSEHPIPSAEWLRTDPAAHDCLDPLVALAFAAATCRRLKVFTNLLVLPYRNPFLTAKAAATLQILSGNRLILGVGLGYMLEEFDALGVPFRQRGALMDEAIETIRLAWQGGVVVKQGRRFNAVGNQARPAPSPPPLWIGGASDRAVERAARHGDGWAPYFTVPTNNPEVLKSSVVSINHFAEKASRLHDLRAEIGRSGPFDMAVAPLFRPKAPNEASARQFCEEVAQLRDLGVNWIWTSLPAPTPERYMEFVAWFGQEIVSRFPSTPIERVDG